jgi:hypothetical protein
LFLRSTKRFLRLVLGNDALQLAPDETRTAAILPGGELVDRLQNIAWNVADRQYLNSQRLRQWSNGSEALTRSSLEINLSPPLPATSAASVVIVLFIFIYLLHISHLFLWERRGEVSERLKNFGKIGVLHLRSARPGTNIRGQVLLTHIAK